MITFEEVGGRQTWRVDRKSIKHMGYAEDMPPYAAITGAIALFMVPVIIICLAAPQGGVKAVGVVAALVLLAGVFECMRTLLSAEKHWQKRQIALDDLSQPSRPRGDKPAKS